MIIDHENSRHSLVRGLCHVAAFVACRGVWTTPFPTQSHRDVYDRIKVACCEPHCPGIWVALTAVFEDVAILQDNVSMPFGLFQL